MKSLLLAFGPKGHDKDDEEDTSAAEDAAQALLDAVKLDDAKAVVEAFRLLKEATCGEED